MRSTGCLTRKLRICALASMATFSLGVLPAQSMLPRIAPRCSSGWQTAFDHSYTGLIWEDGHSSSESAHTAFVLDFTINPSGNLIGKYVEDNGISKAEGSLEPIAEQEPCKVLYRWRQGRHKGIAELWFSSEGDEFGAKFGKPEATTAEGGRSWAGQKLPLRVFEPRPSASQLAPPAR